MTSSLRHFFFLVSTQHSEPMKIETQRPSPRPFISRTSTLRNLPIEISAKKSIQTTTSMTTVPPVVTSMVTSVSTPAVMTAISSMTTTTKDSELKNKKKKLTHDEQLELVSIT